MRSITDEQLKSFEWCLTLPEEMAEATDFKAEEAISINKNIKLPASFSLWKWIYKTSNQWSLWSCTSMWTTHSVQILNVAKKWEIPTNSNIITPNRKDLWWKMWHSITKYDGWDYVEKAVSTALKQWILILEDWSLAKFDWYATAEWDSASNYNISIDTMKRYLYNWNPIVRCVRWDKNMWREMLDWEVKTRPINPTWWHCIALVWWDESWFWFINSREANDDKRLKSRFHITYDNMRKIWIRFNYRYRVLYTKQDAKIDPEYLKRKNQNLLILKVLKKNYDSEFPEIKQAIVNFSQIVRKKYPEINSELPL